MNLPDKFPSGCEFFCTVRQMRNYVRFPDKSLYVLSFKGDELLPIEGIPACPIAPLSEEAFVISASRCRNFCQRRDEAENKRTVAA